MTSTPITALMSGKVAPLGARQVLSGISKQPLTKPLFLSFEGLTGDEQGDRRHHGGPDKALHHYALDHYPTWRSELGSNPALEHAGAFGENIATFGLAESDVAIGDVFRLGEAIVEVSQGRQPCWKLNLRFSVPDMARRVQLTGRTGWYYRVLEPGMVSPRETLIRIERRSPQWTVRRVWEIFYVRTLEGTELSSLSELPHLAESWRRHALRRLETGTLEDWSIRLDGAEPTK